MFQELRALNCSQPVAGSERVYLGLSWQQGYPLVSELGPVAILMSGLICVFK